MNGTINQPITCHEDKSCLITRSFGGHLPQNFLGLELAAAARLGRLWSKV